MDMMLKSIEEEAADCRAAFANVPVGALAWHVHHDVLVEPLALSAEARISYILNHKPEQEQALRLHLFRPVTGPLPPELDKASAELGKASAEWHKASAEWYKARAAWGKACAEWGNACAEWDKACAEWHRQQCPDCPWDGQTIFEEGRE